MIEFIESPRFPTNISIGSSGGPEFRTLVFEGQNGNEQRVVSWSRARASYDVGYGIRDTEDMDIVRSFFYEMRAKAVAFRYKDWADFQLVNEQIGTGNGVQTVFKITKKYGITNAYTRRVFKPVSGTAVVTVNGGASSPTINYALGTVTFAVAPAAAAVIAITCEFDVPVRFDIDKMDSSFEAYQSETWGSIPLLEVRIVDYDEVA